MFLRPNSSESINNLVPSLVLSFNTAINFSIPFINDSYNQIFIDNLQGKENSNILKIMQMKNEDLAKEYIENSDFIGVGASSDNAAGIYIQNGNSW